jgi:hypothetical protein
MTSTNLKNVHSLINISKERASYLDFQIVLFKSFSNKCIPNNLRQIVVELFFRNVLKVIIRMNQKVHKLIEFYIKFMYLRFSAF